MVPKIQVVKDETAKKSLISILNPIPLTFFNDENAKCHNSTPECPIFKIFFCLKDIQKLYLKIVRALFGTKIVKVTAFSGSRGGGQDPLLSGIGLSEVACRYMPSYWRRVKSTDAVKNLALM